MDKTKQWSELAAQLAVDSIRATTEAGSGHATSSLSAAHLAAVLFSDHLRYDVRDPKSPANDRFVLSKGHASPLLYAALKAIGAIDDAALLTLRKNGSPLEGHPAPVPDLPWVDVATGSLGQGLSVGLGMAMAMRLDELPGRVWVMLGDSEMSEGAVWEAMAVASFYRVGNLKAMLDMNRLGQRGPTMLQWNGDAYVERARAFGWKARGIDGHDVAAIDEACREAEEADAPVLIVARTVKGRGASKVEDRDGWHGKPLEEEDAREAIRALGGERSRTVTPPSPPETAKPAAPAHPAVSLPRYEDEEATRTAFGEALAALAPWTDVVALDGEVSDSTRTKLFQKEAPERFFEMYIAEQNMLGAAVGLQALGKRPFVATFGAFMTRAYDQIRMAAVSRANLRLSGSHGGVSIGQDGPSQMGLEDLAMMRAVHGSTVLYPADGNSTAKLVAAMAERDGITYIRTSRGKTPKLYEADEEFPIGGSKVLREGGASDRATLVGAGVTVFEALEAAARLSDDGIPARVIDAYTVKPIDRAALRRALEETGLIVVAEDHWPEGGLGDAVLEALAEGGAPLSGRVVKLGVPVMPGSATPEEQRDRARISAPHIADAVHRALQR